MWSRLRGWCWFGQGWLNMLGNARLSLINSAAMHLQVAAEVLPVAEDRGSVELVESIPFCLAALGTDQIGEKADLMAGII